MVVRVVGHRSRGCADATGGQTSLLRVAPLPFDETRRLEILAEYDVLDSPAEVSFDAITTLAAELLGVPIALVSIVDADRQWFKSRYGLAVPETPRSVSFCSHVVASGAPLVVSDAFDDARFADNPLVTGEPRVRFYAGSPLRTPGGQVLGTLCAIDHEARQLTPRQLELLDLLAGQVVALLELRRRNLLLIEERRTTTRMNRFFELTPDLFCTADDSLHFRELNPAWEKTLGWSLDELRAQPFTDFVHPDDLEATLAEASKLQQEGAVTIGFENRYRHRAGHWVPLSWVAKVDDGCFYASARDVSAERRGELALSASEARARDNEVRLRELLEAMAEGVVVQDENAVILDCNRSAERILGLDRQQILGRSSLDPAWRSLRADGSPFDGEAHPAVVAMRTGEAQNNVVMGVPRAGGETTWISINARPLTAGEGGDSRIVVVTFRDISAERAAEQKAQNAEARLRAVIDTAVDAVLTIDEEGRVETANPAVQRMFGFAAEEVVGRNINILMPSPDRELHDGYLAHYRRSGERRVIGIGREVTAMRQDGSTFPAELAVSEFEIQGRRQFAGILRDISERKQIEQLQADFVSTVSHELRTPLTSIRGSLGLIAASAAGELNERFRALVEIAHRNSERLSRLVDDILDIQKIEAGRMNLRLDRIDIGALTRQAVEVNDSFASQAGIRLETSIAEELPPVIGDEDRLIQVITNLLSNAVKFSPTGGVVRVAVWSIDHRVRIEVRDEGPGVATDFADRIFGKFQQADSSDTRKRGGSGLGLSIAKAIVERLGGRIGFEPGPGSGSIFYFELPALALDERDPAQARPRVLICEDDPDIAHLLRLLLAEAGLDSTIAWTAAEARRCLREETFDAMTLDLLLPDEDGITLMRALRADPLTAALPVVVVSASSREGRAVLEGSGVEVVDWLDKPIDHARLLSALRSGLRDDDRETAILHVEDDPDAVRILGELMCSVGRVVGARSIEEARRLLAARAFDLVVLDLGLPDGSGAALLVDISRMGALAPPVVIFSGREPSRELASRVQAVLVKGQASNEDIARTLKRLIGDKHDATADRRARGGEAP